jgi:hypothetical protein
MSGLLELINKKKVTFPIQVILAHGFLRLMVHE